MKTCVRCGGKLSRYNAGDMCAACQHQTPPVWAWDTPGFRDAVQKGRPGQALECIRRASRMTSSDFAVLLDWDVRTLRRAITGQSNTLFDLRELRRITQVLGIAPESFAPLLGIDATLEGKTEGTDMDRRDFGKTIATTAALTAFGTPTVASASTISPEHIVYLQSTAQGILKAVQVYGGANLVPSATQAYRTARQMLNHSSYTRKIGDDLCTVTAELGSVAGVTVYQSANNEKAEKLFSEALSLSLQGTDTDLTTRILCDMSRLRLILGESVPGLAREAVRLLSRASETSRANRSTILRGDLDLRLAGAHAATGDKREFERFIGWAQNAFTDGYTPGEGDPSRLAYLDEGEMLKVKARGYRLLDDFSQAVDVAQESVSFVAGPLSQAHRRAELASCMASAGDPASIDVGNSILDELGSVVHSPRVLDYLAPVRALAESSKSDEAARFTQRVAAMV